MCCENPHLAVLPLALIVLLFKSSVSATSCYFPDGGMAVSGYVPCNGNPNIVSMCCYTPNGDACTNQGLCVTNGVYFRDYCTDPTWQSKGCVKLCMGRSYQCLPSRSHAWWYHGYKECTANAAHPLRHPKPITSSMRRWQLVLR